MRLVNPSQPWHALCMQEGETEAARKLLAASAVDMEAARLELRGRRQQAQSSLLGLQHRVEALKVPSDTLQHVKSSCQNPLNLKLYPEP